MKYKECLNCNDHTLEYIMTVNNVEEFYCDSCGYEQQTTHELVGPAERFKEETGR